MQLFQGDLAMYIRETLSLSDLCKFAQLIFHRTWAPKSLYTVKYISCFFPSFSCTRWNTIINKLIKRNQIEQCISKLPKTKPSNTCHILNFLPWKITQLDFRFSKLNIQNIHSWDENKHENFSSESNYFEELLVTENKCCFVWICHPLLL